MPKILIELRKMWNETSIDSAHIEKRRWPIKRKKEKKREDVCKQKYVQPNNIFFPHQFVANYPKKGCWVFLLGGGVFALGGPMSLLQLYVCSYWVSLLGGGVHLAERSGGPSCPPLTICFHISIFYSVKYALWSMNCELFKMHIRQLSWVSSRPPPLVLVSIVHCAVYSVQYALRVVQYALRQLCNVE